MMKREIYTVGAGLVAIMASIGIAVAQETPEEQPVPQTPEVTPPSTQVSSPTPLQPGSPSSGTAQPDSPQSSPSSQPGRPSPTPQLTADQVTDEQVEQLVLALSEIEPLLRKASAELQANQDAAKRQQIEQQFESQATQVVESTGLTVEQYIQLVTLAQRDQEFGQRVNQQLEQLQEESESPQSEAVESASPEEEVPTEPSEAEDPSETEEEQ